MPYETILYEVKDHIGYLTLNRPEALNAFNRQMTADIIDCCGKINDDPEVRVVILTGAGDRAFSAGLDLKERAATVEVSLVENRMRRVRPGMTSHHMAVSGIDRPVIGAIHGWAVGGGCELALACDLRVAADNIRIGLMEVKRGIIPGAGGTQRLPRAVPLGIALEMVFTGEPLNAEQALRVGLVNYVVPRDEIIAKAEEIARKIIENAPLAVRTVKAAVLKGLDMPLDQGIRLEADLSSLISTSEDAKEGPKAFAEKRAPVWKGR